MEEAQMHERIRRLAREKGAIILAHNYQRYEVQQAADLVGDSLGLSAKAAETDARMIVFAGVHFMAESAKILSPRKKVVMPRADAGCPLADTITVEKLRALQAEHPGAPTVCYINSAAAIKAEVDVCCTSANMDKVVASLPDRKVLFVPDGNMGRYLQKLLPEKEIVTWKGVCPTHNRLRVDQVLEQKRLHPAAKFIAHPECRLDVIELADAVRSTTGFLRYAKESDATEFIIGTEVGLIPRLEAENPGKRFYPASEEMVCPNMKMTHLEDVLAVLETEDNEILVPDEIRVRAVRALERMLKIT
ncbi:MAG TPA: quinolinate synthase NadA [bacterium]